MCNWKSKYDLEYKCPHKRYKGETENVCIFHSKLEDKDVKEFYEGVKKIYESKKHNFRGFVFPKEFDFNRLSKEGRTDHLVFTNANFSETVFQCNVNLSEAEFSGRGETDFRGATFSGEGGTNFTAATFATEAGVDFSGAVFSGPGKADFCRAIFSSEGGTYLGYTNFSCEGGTSFVGATFTGKGETNFMGATFSGDGVTSFLLATFSGKGETNFVGVTFSSKRGTLLCETTFSSEGGTSFSDAAFSSEGVISFVGTTFSGKGEVRFSGKTFSDIHLVNFNSVTIENPDRVVFDHVDLNHVRFLPTDLSNIRFSNVYWCGRKYSSSSYRGRLKVYDETFQEGGFITRFFQRLKYGLAIFLYEYKKMATFEKIKRKKMKESERIAIETLIFRERPARKERNHYEVYNLYNQLIKNYESNNRYHEAGDFFVGMMEMRRRGKFEKQSIRALLYPYRWISLYGERPLRAFGWLIGSILLFGILNLVVGLGSVDTDLTLTAIKIDTFSIKMLCDCSFWKDYLQAIFVALQPITLGKVGPAYMVKDTLWGPLLRIGETVASALFLSLFLLAMNRKFRRTKD